jgi:hypothetical protein
LEHHDWFGKVGVNMVLLKTGHYDKSSNIFWKPTIQSDKVGEYYYEDGLPLTVYDDLSHTGDDDINHGKGDVDGEIDSSQGSSADLPWHWVF